MQALRRFFGDARGASAVEFALVVVPLLLFLFGTVEFARLMWTRQAMQSLSVTAARCIVLLQPDCVSGGAYDMTTTKNFIIARAGSFGVPLVAGNITIDQTADATQDECRISGFTMVKIDSQFTSPASRLITALAGSTSLQTKACFPNQT